MQHKLGWPGKYETSRGLGSFLWRVLPWLGTLFFPISPALHIMNNAWLATLSQWCRCVPVISCCWITQSASLLRKMLVYGNSTSTHIFLAQCSEWHEIWKTSDGEVSWSVQCPSAPSACQASRSPVDLIPRFVWRVWLCLKEIISFHGQHLTNTNVCIYICIYL